MSASEDPTIPKVAPPIPAPYLADVPQLPDDLLPLMRKRSRLPKDHYHRARALMRDILDKIDAARQRYNEEHGVEIDPEPGTAPLF